MNACLPLAPQMQRSHGTASVTLAIRAGKTALTHLHQAGSAKAILPRSDADGPEVVFLNTSGGLTGGDTLNYALTLGPNCRATATTQTAERAYASADGMAQVRVRHDVGPGAWLDWLPQETILFNASALSRKTEITLAADASCLMLETVILGRAAMGETVSTLAFRDVRSITRAGRPVLLEPIDLAPETLGNRAATLGPNRAFATLALVTQNAADALAPLRRVLDEPGVECAATAFDGKLILRLLSTDGWPLRRQIIRALGILRPGPLPRVWQS